jgi:hypothetical protein
MENPPVFTPQLDTGNFRILSLFRFCYAELEGSLQISGAGSNSTFTKPPPAALPECPSCPTT